MIEKKNDDVPRVFVWLSCVFMEFQTELHGGIIVDPVVIFH